MSERGSIFTRDPFEDQQRHRIEQYEAHVLYRDNDCQQLLTLGHQGTGLLNASCEPVSISAQCSQRPYEADAIENKEKNPWLWLHQQTIVTSAKEMWR